MLILLAGTISVNDVTDGISNIVTLTVTEAGLSTPSAPSSISGITTINSGSSTTLTANGCAGTAKWYDAATNGNLLYTGNPFVPSPTVNTSYYASCYTNSCESQSRTSVTVTVNTCFDNPILPTYNSGNVVQIKAPNTINANNRINAGANVLYQAGGFIALSAGFMVENGAVFKTQMGSCNN